VLDRAEHRRMHAHQEERGDELPEAVGEEAPRGERHHRDLEDLHRARDRGFLQLVGELAGGGGEKKERQEEEPPQQRRERLGVRARQVPGAERDERDERGLEDVVVERAEELRREQRREAALAEEGVLAAHSLRVRHSTRARYARITRLTASRPSFI